MIPCPRTWIKMCTYSESFVIYPCCWFRRSRRPADEPHVESAVRVVKYSICTAYPFAILMISLSYPTIHAITNNAYVRSVPGIPTLRQFVQRPPATPFPFHTRYIVSLYPPSLKSKPKPRCNQNQTQTTRSKQKRDDSVYVKKPEVVSGSKPRSVSINAEHPADVPAPIPIADAAQQVSRHRR